MFRWFNLTPYFDAVGPQRDDHSFVCYFYFLVTLRILRVGEGDEDEFLPVFF